MGKTPFIGLLGLLMAGLALTGCQSSTPRPRAWRDSPPTPGMGKGTTPAEKKPAEVASDKDKGMRPGADFASAGSPPEPLKAEAPPPSGVPTEAKSIGTRIETPVSTKAGQPGRDSDTLPTSKGGLTSDVPSLDSIPSPPPPTAGRMMPARPMPAPMPAVGDRPPQQPTNTTPPGGGPGALLPPISPSSGPPVSPPAPTPPIPPPAPAPSSATPPSAPMPALEPPPGMTPPPGLSPSK